MRWRLFSTSSIKPRHSALNFAAPIVLIASPHMTSLTWSRKNLRRLLPAQTQNRQIKRNQNRHHHHAHHDRNNRLDQAHDRPQPRLPSSSKNSATEFSICGSAPVLSPTSESASFE